MELLSLAGEQTVLIHAATEITGEATVRIAQHIGAKIIVTADGAGTQKVVDIFGLPREFVLSRTSDIAWHVHALTEGEGVNVIFSATKNQSFKEDYTCLKPFARYIEIKKTRWKCQSESSYGMSRLKYCFCSVTFADLMKHRSLELREHGSSTHATSLA